VNVDAGVDEIHVRDMVARQRSLGALDRFEELEAEGVIDQGRELVQLLSVVLEERPAPHVAEKLGDARRTEDREVGGRAQLLYDWGRHLQHVRPHGYAIHHVRAEVLASWP
jgi:hypothetical protein